MNQSTKSSLRSQIKKLKDTFVQSSQLPFSDLLSEQWFERLEAQAGNYRTKVFTPIVTLQAFMRQVLSADGSCKEAVCGIWAWRVQEQLPAPSVSTGAYCKARQRLPLERLSEAVQSTGQTLHSQVPEAWKWHGYNVKMVDGTAAGRYAGQSSAVSAVA